MNTQIPYGQPGDANFSLSSNFVNSSLLMGPEPRLSPAIGGTAGAEIRRFQPVAYAADGKIIPAVFGKSQAVGVANIAAHAGDAVQYWYSGYFNADILEWDTSFNSDKKKASAFNGAPSPVRIRVGSRSGTITETLAASIRAIGGILTAPNVILIGASHSNYSFGGDDSGTVKAMATNTFAALGFTGKLWSFATPSVGVGDGVNQLARARAQASILATQGQNFYLVDLGGNSFEKDGVTNSDFIRDTLDSLLANITATGDKVLLLPQTKRFSPWKGLVAGDDLNTVGSLPYNKNIFYPLIDKYSPDFRFSPDAPFINSYELADKWPFLVSSDGNHGYGLVYYSYILQGLAARARAQFRGKSRKGKSIGFTPKGGTLDYNLKKFNEAVIGAADPDPAWTVNRNLYIGAKCLDGSFDPFFAIRYNYGTYANTSVAMGGLAAHAPRIPDARFHDADLLSKLQIYLDPGETFGFTLFDLEPGSQIRLSVLAAVNAPNTNRIGQYTISNGTDSQMIEIDPSTVAASNVGLFDPIMVPASGQIVVSCQPKSGMAYAYFSGGIIDFL